MLDHTTVGDVRYFLTPKGKAALLDAEADAMELFDLCQHTWRIETFVHRGKRGAILRCEICDDSRDLPADYYQKARQKE